MRFLGFGGKTKFFGFGRKTRCFSFGEKTRFFSFGGKTRFGKTKFFDFGGKTRFLAGKCVVCGFDGKMCFWREKCIFAVLVEKCVFVFGGKVCF